MNAIIQGLMRTAALAALTTWWGGLTFYAAVVVPLGSARFGAAEQGMVTRDATQWLNAMAVAAALGMGYAAWTNPAGRRFGPLLTAVLLAATTGLLAALHLELSRQINPATDEPLEATRFYHWHRAYLLTTTVQWIAGLIAFHRKFI